MSCSLLKKVSRSSTLAKVGLLVLAVGLLSPLAAPRQSHAGEGWIVAVLAPELPLGEHESAFQAVRDLFAILNDDLGGPVTPRFFHQADDLAAFFTGGDQRCLVLASSRFVQEEGENLGLTPLLLPVVDGATTTRMVLVGRNGKGLSLDGLTDHSLALVDVSDSYWSYLESQVVRQSLSREDIQLVTADSGRSAILSVVYGAADAALVSQAEFSFFVAADSEAAAKLEVAWTSAELPSPVLCATRGLSGPGLDAAIDRLAGLHLTESGRGLLADLGLDAFRVEGVGAELQERVVVQQASETTPAEAGLPPVSVTCLDRPETRFDRDKAALGVRARSAGNVTTGTVEVVCVGKGQTLREQARPDHSGTLAAVVDLSPCLEQNVASPTSHTVRQGDTLWGIAKMYLGDSSSYMAIAKLNNIDNPDMIRAGKTLRLPGSVVKALDLSVTIKAMGDEDRPVTGAPTELHLTIW